MSEPSAAGTPTKLGAGAMVGQRYRIEEPLASGGMGVVYRATQQPLGRSVALKVMRRPRDPRLDAEHSARFVREAAAMASLHHPNTVVVYDYGQEEGQLFLAMELIEGLTLTEYVRQRALLTEPQAIHVAKQIASSLRDAHRQGLVHRDLKPGNVMLLTRGGDPFFIKVLDFGLVKNTAATPEIQKLTRTGMIMGSPRYMAPEQIRGENVDHRADIYAFGGLLCWMLSGQSPFSGNSEIEMMRAHLYTRAPRLSELSPTANVSAALEDLIVKCLDKDAVGRFQSMDEVLSALGALSALSDEHSGPRSLAPPAPLRDPKPSAGEPSSTSLSALFTQAILNPGRSKLAWALRIMLAATLLGFGMGIVYFSLRKPPSEPSAQTTPPPSEPPGDFASEPAVEGPRSITIDVLPSTAIIQRNGATIANGSLEFELPIGEAFTFTIAAPEHTAQTIVVDGTTSHVRVELTRESRGPRLGSSTARNGTTPSGTTPSGTGASETGASETGASETGASGTGASGSGTETNASPDSPGEEWVGTGAGTRDIERDWVQRDTLLSPSKNRNSTD